MLRRYPIVLGFLLASAIWAVYLVLQSDASAYYQICEANQYTGKESCSLHHVPYVIAWYIGYWFDKASAVITAFATVAVACFTWTLYQSSEKLGSISGKASDIAEKQIAISGLQTDIQKKQHAVSRLQFLAEHRPLLNVRHVYLTADMEPAGTVTFFIANDIIYGGLSVVNVGGSSATIVRSTYRIFMSQVGLPLRSPLDETYVSLLEKDSVIERGQSVVLNISDRFTGTRGAQNTIGDYCEAGWRFYIMGEIHYVDDGGAGHFMGFCRERHIDGRFRAVDDPDYEYQD